MKPLGDQVLVITGASSGIGLATAEHAAEAGAIVVLVARSEHTLEDIARRIDPTGKRSLVVVCDVAERAQVERAAKRAAERFGRIDTWVNNAGLGMYGRLDECDYEDARRLFDINFWGVVHGSLAALPYLKKSAGTLINVGSEVSEAATPLLGMYTATKHAVKGFTDSLRIELELLENDDVTVTLIQPTAVNTPFPQHARNFMDCEPSLPSPTLDPKQVAAAILNAAERPTRDKKVGGKAMLNTAMAKFLPGLGDRLAAKQASSLRSDAPPRHPAGSLHEASEAAAAAGSTTGLQ